MSKYPAITNTLRGAIKREGYTDKEFASDIGIPYQTLQIRWRDPGSWRFYEWGAVLRRVKFFPEELETIRKEVAK